MAAKPIFVQAVDTNGTPYSGAKLNVYDAGTTTPRAIYTESGLGTASANPAIADANGVVVVWVNDAGGDIKVTLTNSAETVTPHNEDNVPIASLTCYPVITFQGDQSLLTTSSPTFAGLTLGNVSFAGVVTDPNADRLVFWDDSAGQVNFMTLGTGLAFNGTALELDGDLQDISGLTPTDGGVIIGDGTDFVVESGSTLRASLGVAIGSDVQAWDADLDVYAATPLTAAELGELQNIGSTTISATQWGYVGGLDQALATTDSPTFATVTSTSSVIGGVTVSPSGATLGQALGFPNSTSTLEPYTPAGGGDTLAAANETISGNWNYTGAPTLNGSALVSLAATQTLTNKTLTSPVFNGSLSGDAVLDEDNMSSDSASKVPTQQSVKAYVDNAIVDTISALQSISAGLYNVVTVRGRAASGDGGGGVYRWDGSNLSTEVSADEMTASAGDGGVYVAPSSDQTGASGAWVLDVKAELYAGVYGLSASASGAVNQTALQNAITRAQALGVRLNVDVGGTVTIGTGKVTISDDLYLFSTHDTIFFTASGMNDHTFEVNGAGADVVIDGVRTDGNRAANPTSNKSAFHIVSADHVLLRNTHSTDQRYGNIYVNPTGVIKSVRALDTHHVASYGGYFCYGDGSNYVECQEVRGGYWYDFITEAIDFNGTNHPEVNVDISAKRFQTGGAVAGNDEGVDVEGVKSGIINVVLDCDGQARTGIRFKGASEKIIANCVVSNAKSTTLTNEASTDITTDWDITDSAISDVGGNRIDWDGTQTSTATATQTGSTLTADAYYVVRYQVSNMTAGSVTVKLGTASGAARTDNGEYFESIVASSGSPQLALEGDADFDGRIDLDFFLLYEDGSAGVVIGGLSDSIINASVDGCWAGLCCNSTGGTPTGVICNVRSDTHTFAGVYSYATLDYCDFNLNVDGDGYAGFVGDYLQRTRIQGAITEGGGTSTQKIDVCGGLRSLIGPINFGSGAQTGRIDVGDDTDDGGSRVNNIMIVDSRGYRMENWGESSVSPDGSGEFTISHLVRRTPTFATLRIKGDSTDHADVVSISGSTITGRIKDSSGADVTSGTYDVLWEARAVREIGA